MQEVFAMEMRQENSRPDGSRKCKEVSPVPPRERMAIAAVPLCGGIEKQIRGKFTFTKNSWKRGAVTLSCGLTRLSLGWL